MSQSNSNNTFKEILTTASNNFLKKPLTDTLNSLTNMASYSSVPSTSSSSNYGTVNKKDDNKYSKPSYTTQSSSNSTNSTSSYYSTINTHNGATNSTLTSTLLDENIDKQKNKIDQLEFLTTVGTGTFGRVIVVRQKNTHEYYALKIMSIAEVLRLKQTEHVKNEKDILQQVYHPFIINLYA